VSRAGPALIALLLAGCGSVNLWPFGGGSAPETDFRPANAAEYRCAEARKFYVRDLAGGAVWLIAPDREIRLERIGDPQSGRYGTGRVLLEMSGDAATLVDPPVTYSACKRAVR